VKPSPYDQRIARFLVRPLARTPITANHITALTAVMALIAAGLFATGSSGLANWAAGLFVLARFLDHFDGELARLTGQSSRFGYYFDYLTGGISHAALFAGIGYGLSDGPLGAWALAIGALGAVIALVSMFLNLGIDDQMGFEDGETIGYPGYAGFELEDGIYLLAPITWLGWLTPAFVAAGVGAVLYCLWSAWSLLRLRMARDTAP